MLLKYIFRQDISDKLLEIYNPLKEVEEQQELCDFVETILYYLPNAAQQVRADKERRLNNFPISTDEPDFAG